MNVNSDISMRKSNAHIDMVNMLMMLIRIKVLQRCDCPDFYKVEYFVNKYFPKVD